MKVPKKVAEDIVSRMKIIINQDINFIDNEAIIIASTDEKRIGDYHGGAQVALTTRDKVIIKYNEQFTGARKGINLPVYFKNEIVGIIGVTGEENEVVKFGEIIQNMTEILIKEAYLAEQLSIERESKKQIIDDLFFRIDEINEKTIQERSELLNLKLDISRVVVLGRIDELSRDFHLPIPQLKEQIYNLIRDQISNNQQNIVVQSGMYYILLINLQNNEGALPIVKNINATIKEKYNISFYFGIGKISNDVEGLRESFKEAKKAVNIAIKYNKSSIIEFSNMDIELFIDALDTKLKQQYMKYVFKDMDNEDIEEVSGILGMYFKNNGSINKTADDLFIHKNTLQYKLNKIKNLTGFDPRKLEQMVVLYMAIKLFQFEN